MQRPVRPSSIEMASCHMTSARSSRALRASSRSWVSLLVGSVLTLAKDSLTMLALLGYLWRAQPKEDGALQVAGLQREVRLERDAGVQQVERTAVQGQPAQ